MKKLNILKRTLTLIIVLVMVFSNVNLDFVSYLVSYNASNMITEVEAKENKKKAEPTVVKELEDYRTANSSTYLLSDGSKRLELYSTDIRFEKNGKYIDYDPTLKELSDKQKEKFEGYKYVNTAGDSKVYFPENLDEDSGILMKKGDYAITFNPINEKENQSITTEEVEMETFQQEILAQETIAQEVIVTEESLETFIQEENPVLSVDENSVVNNNISYTINNDSIEYKYTSQPYGVKEEIVLNEMPDSNVFSFEFNMPGMELKTIDGYKDIRIIDRKTDKLVAYIEEPNIKDADGELRYDVIFYQVEESEDGNYIVNIVVDEAFLTDKETEYPVVIDPVVLWMDSHLESAAVSTFSGTADINMKNTSTIRVQNKGCSYATYANSENYCYIDTDGLTNGTSFVDPHDGLENLEYTYVDSAELRIREYTSNSFTYMVNQSGATYTANFTPGTVEVRSAESEWQPDTITYNNAPKIGNTVWAEFNPTGVASTEHKINLTNWARKVISREIPNYGLVLKEKISGRGETFYSGRMSYSTDADGNMIGNYMMLTITYRDITRYYGTSGVYSPTGNYSESTTDMTVQTVLGDISLGRVYNSLQAYLPSIAGNGFTFNYAMRVIEKCNGVNVIMPSSAQWHFKQSGFSYVATNNSGTLEKITETDDSGNQSYYFVLTLLDKTMYYFDTNNNLDYILDKYGNKLNFEIDEYGRICYITDTSGTNVIFNYSNNLITRIGEVKNDKNITTVEYSYSEDGNLIKVKYQGGAEKHYDYVNGRISEIRVKGEEDINSLTSVKLTYYGDGEYMGMVKTLTDSVGVKSNYSYDFTNETTTINDYTYTIENDVTKESKVRSIKHTYNDSFAITNIENLLTADEQQVQYDDTVENVNPDNPLSYTDEYGNTTSYKYDESGNLIKTTYPDGSTEISEYYLKSQLEEEGYTEEEIEEIVNLPIRTVDRNGLETVYSYSDEYYVTSVTTGGITMANYTYYPKDTYGIEGLIKTETDANGNVTSYTYDEKGNVMTIAQTIDGQQYVTKYQYEEHGWLVYTKDPNNILTKYTYSNMGNVVLTETMYSPNADDSGIDENAIQYTRTVHDALGRVIQEINTYEYTSTVGAEDDLLNDLYSIDNIGYRTQYNELGQVVKEIDELGNITEYVYDNEGNLEKEIQPNGSYHKYVYDNKGREIKEYFGESTDISEDEEILLCEITYGTTENTVTTKEYITSDKTKYSITVEKYNWEDNLIQMIYPNGLVEAYTYSKGLLTKTSDSEGSWTQYTYDSWGRVLTEKSAFDENGNSVKKYTYDNYGNVIREEVKNNAAGEQDSYAKTEYSYDSRNNLTKTIVYKGEEILKCTQSYYSWDNKLLREYRGMTIPLTINGLDNIANADNQEYSVIKYEYDSYGRLIKKTDALDQVETYSYDVEGRKVGQVDRNEVSHTIDYDKNDNVIREESGANTESADDDIIKTYTYDCMGNTLTETEGNITTTFTYDEQDNCVKECIVETSTDENGDVQETEKVKKEYTFDLSGNMLTQTVTVDSQVQQNISYEYDVDGNMTKVEENDTEVATYTYDKKGQLITTVNGNGTVETNTYNLAGLVTSTLNKNSNSIISHYEYTYYYDGQQKSKTDNSGKSTYVYDEAGQLIKEIREDNEYANVDNTIMGNAIPISIDSLVYVNAKDTYVMKYFSFIPAVTDTYIISTEQYSGHPVIYLYSSTGTYITSKSYDGDGNIIELEVGLTAGTEYLIGIVESIGTGWCSFKIEQDLSDGQTTLETAKHIEEETVIKVTNNDYNTAYFYSFIPKKTGIYTIESSNNSGLPSATLYNASETQLTGATNNGVNGNFIIEYELIKGEMYCISTRDISMVEEYDIVITPPQKDYANQTTYTYDANGNRVKLTETEGDTTIEIIYAYDENDRLKSEKQGEDITVTYEYDKNGNNISKSDGTLHTFDVLNRMTSYKAPDGTTTTYTYYPDDMRRSKKVGTSDVLTQVWVGSEITLDMQGDSIKSYIHGNKLIKEGSTWYSYNAHGDVTTLTDSTGAVTKNYEYDAFGVQLTEEDATDINPYRYSGEYYDFESGYTYLRARYYDPSIGRFINEDPALDGSNWYVYCGNNPIGMIDPSGLWSKRIHGSITYDALDKVKKLKNKRKFKTKKLKKGCIYPDVHRNEGNWGKPKWHGKGDNYDDDIGYQMDDAVEAWNQGKYAKACLYLGIGLHIVQDRQAHMVKYNETLVKAKEVAFGKLKYKGEYVEINPGQNICVAVTISVSKKKMNKFLDDNFIGDCATYGVNDENINKYIGKKIHKITADNIYADFENDKWVYKKNGGQRYKNSIDNSEDYLREFYDRIK